MKFEPGNILEHTPTKTRWIVLTNKSLPKNNLYKQSVKAFCIYVGTHSRAREYWKINDINEFVLTDQDLHPEDYVWKIKHHEKQI